MNKGDNETKMNLVTVSIASYNNGLYIERCIDSVLNQTYQDLEILIVDDGSTDNTLDIIVKYQKDKRVVIIEKENGGLSSVRQRALDEANGDYICFIDADDYLDPHYVECMLTKLIKDRSDICVCSTRFEDQSGVFLPRETRGFYCEESLVPISMDFTISENVESNIIKQLHLSDSWDKMYSMSFLRKCEVKFNMPKGFNGTDTLFNRMLAIHSPLYSTVKGELYIHVIYTSSAVHRKKKNLLFSYQYITENTINESKKLGIYDKTKKMIISKYQKNLFDVLVDEFKESKSYFLAIKIFQTIKNDNRLFAERVEKELLSLQYSTERPVKYCLYMFIHFLFILPIAMLAGQLSHQLTRSSNIYEYFHKKRSIWIY